MGQPRHRCEMVWSLILLVSAASKMSAFIPSLVSRDPLDPASATTPKRHHLHNGNRGRRPRQMTELSAAAPHAPSEGDFSESPSSEVGGGGGVRNGDTPPAGASTAPQVETAEVPSYRRLYDSAMRLLEREMTLDPYPIPDGLEENTAVVGKGLRRQTVKTSITAFKSSKFRQIRTALVETDGPTQVLNLVVFPYPSYDLPIFGADLVSLPGVHLICIDLQPAHSSQQRDDKTDAAMRDIHTRHLERLPWGGDLPEAAREFFSPYCLWAKLDPKEAVEQKALDAMMDYLNEYIRQAAEAKALDGDGPLDKIAAGHAHYSKYRRENDPARGMLTRFYGAEWTEAAIEGILFDYRGSNHVD